MTTHIIVILTLTHVRAKIRLSCLKLLVDHKNPPESLQNCRIWKDLRNPADDYIAKCTIFRFCLYHADFATEATAGRVATRTVNASIKFVKQMLLFVGRDVVAKSPLGLVTG